MPGDKGKEVPRQQTDQPPHIIDALRVQALRAQQELPGSSHTHGQEAKRDASRAFGEDNTNKSPKRRAIEASEHTGGQEQLSIADWEKAREQLLQAQNNESQQFRQQEPRDYPGEASMTRRHTKALKALLERKPKETSHENDRPPSGPNETAPEELSPFRRGILESAGLLQQRRRQEGNNSQ